MNKKCVTRRTAIKQAAAGTAGLGLFGFGALGCTTQATMPSTGDQDGAASVQATTTAGAGTEGAPMNILVLNGSPHTNGNTVQMIEAFKEGAESAGHTVNVVNAYEVDVNGCLGCEACLETGVCVQNDDFTEKIRPLIDEADMRVLASPVHYLGLSGPLQTIIGRFRAPAYVGCYSTMNKEALILSSAIDNYYGGIIFSHLGDCNLLSLKSMGIFTAPGCIFTEPGNEERAAAMLEDLRAFGESL